MSQTIFAGTFNERGTSHPHDHKAGSLMWEGLQQLNWWLDHLLHRSGLDRACAELKDLCIKVRGDDFYAVDPSLSYFESKRVFYAFVHVDYRGYRNGFDNIERFWRELRICVEAFQFIGKTFNASTETMTYLQRELDALPESPPWPPIPDVKPFVPLQGEKSAASAELPDEPGVLWVTMPDDADVVIQSIFEGLTAFVQEKALGEWDGDSRGGGEADISFEVESLSRAAKRIRAFLKKRWPDRAFAVSDQPSDALGRT